MKLITKMNFVMLLMWALCSCMCLLQGCSSDTGLDKRTTLVPDRIGISYGQERYRGDNAAWSGFTLSLGWDLK